MSRGTARSVSGREGRARGRFDRPRGRTSRPRSEVGGVCGKTIRPRRNLDQKRSAALQARSNVDQKRSAAVQTRSNLLVYSGRSPFFGTDPVAHHDPVKLLVPEAGPRDPSPPEVLVKTAEEKHADELVRDAEDALAKKDWKRCDNDLWSAWYTDAGDRAKMSELSSECRKQSGGDLNSKGKDPNKKTTK